MKTIIYAACFGFAFFITCGSVLHWRQRWLNRKRIDIKSERDK